VRFAAAMTAKRTNSGPVGGERVEAEREFLFRSLDDLEAERAAGNIDDATYERLHSDYTARAAASLRAGTGGPPEPPDPATVAPPVSTRRRVLTVGGIVAFGVIVAIVLTSALGGRMPGQTGSGNTDTVSQAERQATLERAIRETPDDPQAHLALARFLMAREQYPEAFAEFASVTTIDPNIAEAQAYSGWLLYLAGRIDDAIVRLDAAIAADETYPDAHFFKGVALFRGKSDAAGAIPQFQRYLTLVPDSPLSDQVRGLLAEAVAASNTP
jgi:cytochrome c-type biogenesis protein CcmH